MSLEREWQTYLRERPAWVQSGLVGKWAVIHQEEVLGLYGGLQEALEAGYTRYGLDEPFMARQIAEQLGEPSMSHVSRNLSPDGALVDVRIGVITARRHALISTGLPIPAPIVIKAQIDTGAYRSGIDSGILRQLELWGPIDREEYYSSSTDDTPAVGEVYAVELTLLSPDDSRTFDMWPVLAHSFAGCEARAVIGRDLLAHCTFKYIGPAQAFEFIF